MMTINAHAKQIKRDKLNSLVSAYLANGGTIKHVEPRRRDKKKNSKKEQGE